MPRYNPFAVRRTVRFQEVVNDDIATFTTKSFTSADAEDKYHPSVDLATGEVTCDCPHFHYRLARLSPTVDDAGSLCKHLIGAVENLKHRGLLREKGGVR